MGGGGGGCIGLPAGLYGLSLLWQSFRLYSWEHEPRNMQNEIPPLELHCGGGGNAVDLIRFCGREGP